MVAIILQKISSSAFSIAKISFRFELLFAICTPKKKNLAVWFLSRSLPYVLIRRSTESPTVSGPISALGAARLQGVFQDSCLYGHMAIIILGTNIFQTKSVTRFIMLLYSNH
jgi:hypothetical protein